MAKRTPNTDEDKQPPSFDHLLSQEPFTGLKAILDRLSSDKETLRRAVRGANSYEALLARLGYKLTLTKQIHVQDAFSRTGAAGDVKTVLPYYDIPTQRSLPTLINQDSTITTTPAGAEFFNGLLTKLKSLAAKPRPELA